MLCIINKILLFPVKWLQDKPVLYHGKHINLVAFGIFAALEATSIYLVEIWYLYLKGVAITSSVSLSFLIVALCVFLGARLLSLFALGKKFFDEPKRYINETGFYVQGGVIGGFVGVLVVSYILNLNVLFITDGLALGILLGQFFGRIGCFNYGCCFGKEIGKRGCGIAYSNEEVKALRLRPILKKRPLYPAQLYDSYANLMMFIVTLYLLHKFIFPNGFLSVLFLLFFSLSRILLEKVRFDIYHNGTRNWTTFCLSVFFFAVGVSTLIIGRYIFSDFGKITPWQHAFSINNLFFVSSIPMVQTVVLILGVFIFIAYGIHGKKLGMFPWYSEK